MTNLFRWHLYFIIADLQLLFPLHSKYKTVQQFISGIIKLQILRTKCLVMPLWFWLSVILHVTKSLYRNDLRWRTLHRMYIETYRSKCSRNFISSFCWCEIECECEWVLCESDNENVSTHICVRGLNESSAFLLFDKMRLEWTHFPA